MEKFPHEYEIIMADIEKTERNAERFVLLTRAIKNQKFFLRQRAKTASREELEKIDPKTGEVLTIEITNDTNKD